VEDTLAPLLGETVWHTLVYDPSIPDVSKAHYRDVLRVLQSHGGALPRELQVLEAGAYAHTTIYALAQRLGARSTALDISTSTLRAGGRFAADAGLPLERTRRVAADMHALPFEDGQFHFVYICSALHHASNWQRALSELVRIVAPGGLLYLQNEPCLRELCFYRFRTNRVDALTPFESKLAALGAIRTVAEPHLGSRPETLFGMVENQTMPLDAMAAAVETQCEVVELRVVPEQCMGPLEDELLDRPAEKLRAVFAQAAPVLGELEKGLGFSLPTPDETNALCSRLAPRLAALPRGQRARALRRMERLLLRVTGQRWPRRSNAYRMELARLFGAGVSLVARKRGAPDTLAGGRLNADYPEEDGVVLGFKPEVRRLLGERNRFFPDLQTASEEALRAVFPVTDWDLDRSANGFRSVVARERRARIACALPGRPLRLFFRVHATRREAPYQISLMQGERELGAASVYQTESLLLAGHSSSADELAVTASGPGRVAISCAGSVPA
jgi:SAM-dependent methyltransferase